MHEKQSEGENLAAFAVISKVFYVIQKYQIIVTTSELVFIWANVIEGGDTDES